MFLIRTLAWGLNCLPVERAVSVVCGLIKIGIFLAPRHERVAHRNFNLAFPDKGAAWKDEIWAGSLRSLARVVVDAVRLPKINAAWIQEHIDWPGRREFENLKRSHPGQGVLIASGHLGSFELLAQFTPTIGYPLAVIARPFKLKKVDAWWNGLRQVHGNYVVARRGAFSQVLQDLKSGQDVAVLIDQNVTAKYAVFVDWFGTPAATTRMFALAALRVSAPIVVASLSYRGGDKYDMHTVVMDLTSVYDSQLDFEGKLEEITRRVSRQYEEMIRANPQEWFWMHRRWRTRPEGELENIYDGC